MAGSIIAVHGLGSEFPSCWTEKESGIMFLKEFLPKDFPQARILAFVYPSEPFSNPVHVHLKELGGRLLRSLAEDRDRASIKVSIAGFSSFNLTLIVRLTWVSRKIGR